MAAHPFSIDTSKATPISLGALSDQQLVDALANETSRLIITVARSGAAKVRRPRDRRTGASAPSTAAA